MKKRIVLATDFSGTSHKAYLFARRMAEQFNLPLEVINVVNGNIDPIKSRTNDRLRNFVDLYPRQLNDSVLTKLEIEHRVIKGNPIEMLLLLSQEPDIEMMVLGATGISDKVESPFGSVSASVAQKASCPVLLIPKEAEFSELKNILFASNLESATESMVKEAARIGNLFRSALHFIHVNDNVEVEEVEEIQDRIFNFIFEKGDPAYSFNLASVESNNVTTGLNQYAEENDINLIMMVNKQYDFFDQFFEMSETRKMVAFSKKALLVLHDRS